MLLKMLKFTSKFFFKEKLNCLTKYHVFIFLLYKIFIQSFLLLDIFPFYLLELLLLMENSEN